MKKWHDPDTLIWIIFGLQVITMIGFYWASYIALTTSWELQAINMNVLNQIINASVIP